MAHTIEKHWRLPQPRERLYDAWVSSDTVIPPATRMDVRAEVGGHYRLFIETDELTARAEGTFSEVEPGLRLVYSWAWDDGPESRIEVVFEDDGDGTALRLVHSGLPDEDARTAHDAGWDAYVAQLRTLLGGAASMETP